MSWQAPLRSVIEDESRPVTSATAERNVGLKGTCKRHSRRKLRLHFGWHTLPTCKSSGRHRCNSWLRRSIQWSRSSFFRLSVRFQQALDVYDVLLLVACILFIPTCYWWRFLDATR